MLPLAFVPTLPPPPPPTTVVPRPVVSPPNPQPVPVQPVGYRPLPASLPPRSTATIPGRGGEPPTTIIFVPPVPQAAGLWRIRLGVQNHLPNCQPGLTTPPAESANVLQVFALSVTSVVFDEPIPFGGCLLVRTGRYSYIDLNGEFQTQSIGVPFGSNRPEWYGALIVAPAGSGIEDQEVPPGPTPPKPLPRDQRWPAPPEPASPRSPLGDLFEDFFSGDLLDRIVPPPPIQRRTIPDIPIPTVPPIPDVYRDIPRGPNSREPERLDTSGRRPSGRRFRSDRRIFIPPPPGRVLPSPLPSRRPDPSPVKKPDWSPIPKELPPPVRPRPSDRPVPVPVPLPTVEPPPPSPRPETPSYPVPEPYEVPKDVPKPVPIRRDNPLPRRRPDPAPVPFPIPGTDPAPAPTPFPQTQPLKIPVPSPLVLPVPVPVQVREPFLDLDPPPDLLEVPEPPETPDEECVCYEELDDQEDILVVRYINLLVPVARCTYSDQDEEWKVVYEPNLLPVLKAREGDEADTVLAVFDQANSQTENLCELLNNTAARQKQATLIGSGTSQPGSDVVYYPISPKVRRVWLQLTGEIPSNITLYGTSTSNEAQAKFGNIASCSRSQNGSWAQDADPGWVWTRNTTYDLSPSYEQPRAIRLVLKTGLSYELWDSGVRI